MPLRLRPSVSILVSGTCAFLGWWWWRRYTSRNKGQLQGRNEEIGTPVCLHTSTQDRSNGLMGKSCPDVAPCDSDTDHPKGKAEGGIEEQIYVQDVSRTSSPPSGVEDLVSHVADAAREHGDNSDQMHGVAEAARPADMRSPQLELELVEEDHVSRDVAHYSAIVNTSSPLPGEMPDTANLEEVPNAVRPQPVGEEVVCDKTTVPFMSSQADLVGGDQRSIPAAGEQACMWACRDMHRSEPGVAPGTSPCCTVPASLATRGAADPQDNGLPAEATDINTSIGEIQQLATRIVAGVISAAVELMRESSRHDSAKAEEDQARQEEGEGSGSLSELTGGAPASNSQPRLLQEAAMLMDGGLTAVELQDLPRRSLSDMNGTDAEADQQVVLEARLSRAAREVKCCLASRPCANAEGEYGAQAREGPPQEEERAGSRSLSELIDGTPVSSSQPCPVQEAVMDGGLTTVEPQDLPRGALSDVSGADTDPQVPAEANGCLASRPCAATEDECGVESGPETVLVKVKEGVVSPVLASLKAEEAVAGSEDSGCSTCHSDEWMSSEDLLHSSGVSCAAPISTEDTSLLSGACRQGLDRRALIASVRKVMGLPDAGLYNGTHTSEMEADQSGGSDVNSMDSVEGSSMGEASHSRGSQPPQPQTSELVIWEIEVPKHLVGRLIGKQGRFVSYLKLNSGAKIYVSTLPYTQDFQICHIEGMQHQVDKALTLIGKKFKDLDLANLYAPPHPPIGLPSLPMTSWLLLPNGVMVEVIVVSIVSAGHVFVQQHTHPTYHALRSLDQQMYMCYSQPGTPCLPCPVKVGVICAAPAVEGAWWRAQVISYYKDSEEVEIRYVDYGGYDRVKVDVLRQIRSDFVTLPFQGAEVLLDNLAPLPGADRFSAEASAALGEMTRGVALLTEVTNYDNHTGLPLVQLWNVVGDELVSVNRTLAERGLGTWVDSF